jgi:hypothetical protein
MSELRRRRFWVPGILALAAVAGVAGVVGVTVKGRRAATAPARALDDKTPMAELTAALRESDARALAVLFQKSAVAPNTPAKPFTDAEAAEWVEALKGIRTGFLKFGTVARSSALTVAGRVLQRFGADPCPASWADALPAVQHLLNAGLADPQPDVRVSALMEIGKLWSWMPGRTLLKAEEEVLAEWKQEFVTPVVRRLGDREAGSRRAAVACLGYLPVDGAAAHAVSYVDDPSSPEVRKQVLISFAARPMLLSEEVVLRHMYDKEAGIPQVAETVLKTRGLTQEQISLGSMIFHPKPEIRASVIPLLKNRTDIDPVVWLLQLSRDAEESVRISAVDALSKRLTPEVGQRLAEMAATDKSPAVRRAASKYLPEVQKTVSLPPLPGSPALLPKAN